MYAIFEDGSHQYKVSPGDLVTVDYREAEPGTRVEFSRVLLYSNGTDLRIGQPALDGLRVLGEVTEHPSTKLYIQHFRKRKNYRRLRGHRQHYTAVRVKHILLPGQSEPAAPPVGAAGLPQPIAGSSPMPSPQPALVPAS